MKKVLIFYAILVVVIVAFAISRGSNLLSFFGNPTNATATINGTTYKLLLAKTPAEQIKGLSKRNGLASDTGMLFIFNTKGIYKFWMRDMRFPIDMIWINDNKVVYLVENATPPVAGQDPRTTTKTPDAEANYVLEINAHEITKHKIKKGDSVILKGIK